MTALISVSSITNAAPIIVTVTQDVVYTQSVATPSGYELDFFFQPFTIVPPNTTAITVKFNGAIIPGNRTSANGPVDFVTLQPYAAFSNDLPPQANLLVPTFSTRGIGTPVTVPYNNTTHRPLSTFQTISTSGSFVVNADLLRELSSNPFSLQVTLYSIITGNTPDTTTFVNDQVDDSTGSGGVTLTLTGTTIPEPASAALLAVGALAAIVRKRRPLQA